MSVVSIEGKLARKNNAETNRKFLFPGPEFQQGDTTKEAEADAGDVSYWIKASF